VQELWAAGVKEEEEEKKKKKKQKNKKGKQQEQRDMPVGVAAFCKKNALLARLIASRLDDCDEDTVQQLLRGRPRLKAAFIDSIVQAGDTYVKVREEKANSGRGRMS
jgi:hypothetical protein